MNKNIKHSQNFLTSEKILNQIIKKIALQPSDIIYEIGTGKGHLTARLTQVSQKVISVELDERLFNYSSIKFQDEKDIILIHQDILQFEYPSKNSYKIVGNIPYNLSTQIIRKVVFESAASEIFLIIEEGFYKRILDCHRTLGLLLHTCISIQLLLKIPARYFHPKPKVSSVLIKLTRHPSHIKAKDWEKYQYFIIHWVNRNYRKLFTKNQLHQAMKHAKIKDISTANYEQILSVFNSYILFNPR